MPRPAVAVVPEPVAVEPVFVGLGGPRKLLALAAGIEAVGGEIPAAALALASVLGVVALADRTRALAGVALVAGDGGHGRIGSLTGDLSRPTRRDGHPSEPSKERGDARKTCRALVTGLARGVVSTPGTSPLS